MRAARERERAVLQALMRPVTPAPAPKQAPKRRPRVAPRRRRAGATRLESSLVHVLDDGTLLASSDALELGTDDKRVVVCSDTGVRITFNAMYRVEYTDSRNHAATAYTATYVDTKTMRLKSAILLVANRPDMTADLGWLDNVMYLKMVGSE